MKIVVQRVDKSTIHINGSLQRSIGKGLMVLVGIEHSDQMEDALWLANKLVNLRIFDDKQGIMNLSVKDINGEIMVVSQFTLHAKTKKGNRPSYINAADPTIAIPIYQYFIVEIQKLVANPIQTGEFGAHMVIDFINNGPVTIIIDTKNKE